MLRQIRWRLTFANVASGLALFVALATGGAYAANTVFSSDIVDGQVKAVDLGDAAVRTEKIAGGAVTTDKVQDDTLRGRDVLDNGLKGADIDESTLSNIGGGGPAGGDLTGTYPNPTIEANAVGGGKVADNSLTGSDVLDNSLSGSDIDEGTLAQAGTGRSDLDACNPNSTTYLSCAQTVVTLQHPGRLLLIGSAYYAPDDSDDGAYWGVCRLVDSRGNIYMTRDRFSDDSNSIGTVPFTVVTDVLPAGIHSARIECMEPSTDYGIIFPETSMAVVGLSSR